MAKSNTREKIWFWLAVPEDDSLKWPGGRSRKLAGYSFHPYTRNRKREEEEG